MKFRDDIDLENTWVVSDTHFGHENIVGFCFRPEDHDQVMIAQWRATVPDDATVLHLGDLAYKSNARFKALTSKELTGERKLLVRGNHDQQRFSFYKQSGFKLIQPFMLALRLNGRGFEAFAPSLEDPVRLDEGHRTVSFAHYPWNVQDEGLMPYGHTRVHGHIHNNGYTRDGFVPFLKDHINLSVEQMRYTPVNLKLMLEAALLGVYPETTEEQLADARARKEEAQSHA